MTVTTTDTQTETLADGSAVTFNFDFQTLSSTWVFAQTIDSFGAATERTDITVVAYQNQELNPGGTVTFSTPPASGLVVRLYRSIPPTQLVDYTAYGAFPAESTEDALDKLTMLLQQQEANGGDFVSPVLIESENPSTSPFPLSIRFLEGLGSTPWSLETVPFQPGRGNGLKSTTLFSATGVQYDFFTTIFEDRGLITVPSHPLATDVTALATVQFVLDNSGGPGSDPTFNSVKISHDTDIPANGNAVVAYTTDLTPVVTHTFDDPTGAKAWSWSTIGASDVVYDFVMLNEFMALPTPLASYTGGAANIATTKEYVDSVAGGGTGPFIADAGSVSAPAFTFVGDENTGVFSSNAGAVNVTTDGVERAAFSAFGIALTGSVSSSALVSDQLLYGSASGIITSKAKSSYRGIPVADATILSTGVFNAGYGITGSTYIGPYYRLFIPAISAADRWGLVQVTPGDAGICVGYSWASDTELRLTFTNSVSGAVLQTFFSVTIKDLNN
jgi:hypothetical protein